MNNIIGDFINIAESKTKSISSCELNQKPQGILVDIRNKIERKNGFIDNSFAITRDKIDFRIENILSAWPIDNKKLLKIILYCSNGKYSLVSAYHLTLMGFDNVFYLKGGFNEWCNNNYDISYNQT